MTLETGNVVAIVAAGTGRFVGRDSVVDKADSMFVDPAAGDSRMNVFVVVVHLARSVRLVFARPVAGMAVVEDVVLAFADLDEKLEAQNTDSEDARTFFVVPVE